MSNEKSHETHETHDQVECEICKSQLQFLAIHLRVKHFLTSEEYRTKFPGAVISSLAYRKKLSDSRRGIAVPLRFAH